MRGLTHVTMLCSVNVVPKRKKQHKILNIPFNVNKCSYLLAKDAIQIQIAKCKRKTTSTANFTLFTLMSNVDVPLPKASPQKQCPNKSSGCRVHHGFDIFFNNYTLI